MNKIFNYVALLFIVLITTSSFAQKRGKTEVIDYSENKEAPLPMAKTNKEGKTIYDPRVFGSPKFFPGAITTITGQEIKGSIAVFNDPVRDWNFVKHALLFIPEGENIAQYLTAGTVVYILQKRKKEDHHYDYYDGIYLRRLISGKLRLSYNPAANNARKISQFVSRNFMDSISNKMIKKSIENDLKEGKNIEEVIGKIKLKNDAVDAFSQVEITEKEYLLFNASTQETMGLNKNNYAAILNPLLNNCKNISEKEAKKYLKNYSNIQEVIEFLNTSCTQ